MASRETLEAGVRALAPSGRLVIIGSRPPDVFGADPTFRVDPQPMLNRGFEIHGSRTRIAYCARMRWSGAPR